MVGHLGEPESALNGGRWKRKPGRGEIGGWTTKGFGGQAGPLAAFVREKPITTLRGPNCERSYSLGRAVEAENT